MWFAFDQNSKKENSPSTKPGVISISRGYVREMRMLWEISYCSRTSPKPCNANLLAAYAA
jgi:hypothetical protein